MEIKLMATAGFVVANRMCNVRKFLAQAHHATINGTNWTYALVDPTLPAEIAGVVSRQFGRDQDFLVTWDPETQTWTDGSGRLCHGHIYG